MPTTFYPHFWQRVNACDLAYLDRKFVVSHSYAKMLSSYSRWLAPGSPAVPYAPGSFH